MDKSLVIIRGVQGSGKSTLAGMYEVHGYKHLEADMFFIDPLTGEYKWDPLKIHLAHGWCETQAEDYMKKGYNVVVSNTFVRKKEFASYVTLAHTYGYTVQEIICRGRFTNVHGVPEDTIQKKLHSFEF